MNDIFTKHSFQELRGFSADPSVSIYLPTQRVTEAVKQDPIRLRNLLSAARDQLREQGFNHPQAEAFVQPAAELIEDRKFWEHQSDGLALFLADGFARIYRLPYSFPETVVVDDRFHTTPLVPLIASDDHYYILALSQNEVVLWQGDRTGVDLMELPDDMPTSLAEARPGGGDGRQLQWHTGSAPAPRGGRRAAMFHGHGGESDEKAEIERFFRQVDAAVSDLLRGDDAPVVLAGVDYLLTRYTGVSSLRTIAEQTITGNPEELQARGLHGRAWEIVAPLLAAPRLQALDAYRARLGQELASNNVLEIVPAIFAGRVESAVVALDAHIWGRYEPETNTVTVDGEQTEENDDLLELIAEQTLLHGGEIFALHEDEMPDGAQVAAVYRF